MKPKPKKKAAPKKLAAPVIEPGMKVEWWPIDRLVPYPANARKLSSRAVDTVAASIKEFGWRQPIVADEHDVIVVGHTRLLGARKLELALVPVHVAAGLTPAQVKAYRLMDNRSADEAAWDLELLQTEMTELVGQIDTSLTGFKEREIAELLAAAGGDGTEDEVPEPPAVPVAQLGDVWTLGTHVVVCGDATSEVIVNRLIGQQKIDMVLTDPPYGISLDCDWSKVKGSLKSIGRRGGTSGKAYAQITGDDKPFDASLVFGTNGVKEQFWFGGDYYVRTLPDAKSWLVWDKRRETQDEGFGSGFELIWCSQKHKRMLLRHEWFGFLSGGNKEAVNRQHPTQKPTAVLRDIMCRWGAIGDLVYDPFLGSGSTLIAAESENRRCYGLEIEPSYVDVIITRWQNFTGQQATLDGDGRTFEEVAKARK